ncbi:MAG: sigma 54-interacting transcriptional regulator [Desulfobacterales bacterium]|jgi:DNA-binding NtrC family response regulator
MTIHPGGKALILIIDDEPILRESVATYLQDSGFSTIQAADGPEGLERFEQHRPGLVLLDLRMPKMDGLEVLEKIRQRAAETPVIVVTGAGVLQDAVAALRLGAAEFVTKPILDMAVLEHAVVSALERARLVAENRRYREHLETEIQARTADLERIVHLFEGFIYAVDEAFGLSFMNRKMVEALGGDADTAGNRCFHRIYGLKAPCPWCRLSEVFEGRTARFEIRHPEDGRWYYAIQSPVGAADGAVKTCQTVLIDITDRKTAEEHLRKQEAMLREENARLRYSMKGAIRFGNIVGRSQPMQRVYEAILQASESDANVIVYGESGTGKELVAHTIHDLSRRGGRPFVTVHCGAIPDNLMESEFFGYKKGAFTGADADKPGYLAAADGGTLFLDEVGELKTNMQVKLLRAVEGAGYTPVGGSEVRRSDIRIIAATNRDLKRSVQEGRIRKDFFYRIHVIPIHLPRLRDRAEDIPLLVHHFLQLYAAGKNQRVGSLPPAQMTELARYDWPGNVRELQNAIQRFITLGKFDLVPIEKPSEPGPVPAGESTGISAQGPEEKPLQEAVRRFERAYIEGLLQAHQWHRSKVARILGIDRRTLFRKIKSLGL